MVHLKGRPTLAYMEKIKQYQITIYFATILLLLGFAFYWYEWRPIEIRKKCYDISLLGWTQNGEINYKNCLRDNGLEK